MHIYIIWYPPGPTFHAVFLVFAVLFPNIYTIKIAFEDANESCANETISTTPASTPISSGSLLFLLPVSLESFCRQFFSHEKHRDKGRQSRIISAQASKKSHGKQKETKEDKAGSPLPTKRSMGNKGKQSQIPSPYHIQKSDGKHSKTRIRKDHLSPASRRARQSGAKGHAAESFLSFGDQRG